ncbi:mandelate racemase/muconate lactonizing enzyme family protein [Aquamicrobium sp. NLF2-7]|uniref:mandelate racemase/muconate lactonizing enzyme family protein n=1 Tax=Aquamicrobium sp. NLF2-7 TaxID=2918753 RepID=UPI001EFA6466|nr:mandelate racemase/muconate lactonizing enzyme family protein [Aquamicrobium sp. NLF2-7]MCG8274642.1 mandelate racemase/muconate lactonizing enzyme family protein [Aquamicrobium sp. NLF2-7]
MSSPVASVEVFTLTQPRKVPYLGALREGEVVNPNGYIVRKGNRTVYPTFDRSVLVRMVTEDGVVGWGETYGIVAPGAVAAIINDLLAGFVIGREASDPSAIYDDLYDMMRVRGYTGGFYVDALAALDIALWDIAGQEAGKSVREMLGGGREDFPAYVSGLPEKTLMARGELAKQWQDRGFDAFKFATPVADDGPAREMENLREVLGPQAKIAADMHWNQTPERALELIGEMAPFDPWFAEAPVWTEDIAGLETVSKGTDIPIAVGEEWRTHWDMLARIGRCRIAIVQPEMGHKGITNFIRIGALAAQNGIDVIPHATIGAGIFLAASLQAASTLPTLKGHEFQHSIFEPNRRLLSGDMDCREGRYHLPTGPGLGVRPSEAALSLLERI